MSMADIGETVLLILLKEEFQKIIKKHERVPGTKENTHNIEVELELLLSKIIIKPKIVIEFNPDTGIMDIYPGNSDTQELLNLLTMSDRKEVENDNERT